MFFFKFYFNSHIRDAPSGALEYGLCCLPLVGEGPVVGLIIEPTPGNRFCKLFPLLLREIIMAGNTDQRVFSGRPIILGLVYRKGMYSERGRSKIYMVALTCLAVARYF